ncbi:hypothetical protein AXG93_763s1360 [Marchantia polymorpha subsp. ruderalis]|uniref:Uncharacterized protein n=1 Tax=Marchantia polymorpha subsp. ruderalis TaxID=1480154 RepID=A0A176WS48_MARPO|nr:hypothetical protein AXG93_763s1360 [Marchantia polymorpha subsp. ruderalis]
MVAGEQALQSPVEMNRGPLLVTVPVVNRNPRPNPKLRAAAARPHHHHLRHHPRAYKMVRAVTPSGLHMSGEDEP